MGYKSLEKCILDLEKHGHLVRVKEEVDPNLEMAAIHRRVYDRQGPALYFENIKGSTFPAVSNLFGTLERSRFIFRDTLDQVKRLVDLRSNPMAALRKPFQHFSIGMAALSALPYKKKKNKASLLFKETQISKLPQIINWSLDGGAFITMPQVYTEDIEHPGVMNANVGMYRIQISGNQYLQDQEVGLHYQLHRGIGIHQAKANALGRPLKVSVFIGGPPSHALAAVMPLPEGLSELTFAGVLGNRRFRYFYDEGFCISADADFVITGTVYPGENKPEGPFGDHLGYYSLTHPFPLMRVHRVYHKKNPIWSFTVVGRPPQEDTSFGALIHEITGSAIPKEINGLHAIHAVDAAGVHPLLFAIGSERYTPYIKIQRPQEILTIANQILGTNQLSLAKYLFIAAKEDDPTLDIYDIPAFLSHVLARIDPKRDLHFQTQTTIDTLDYSGDELNMGSKVIFAAAGEKKRDLLKEIPADFPLIRGFWNGEMILPGVLVVETEGFSNYEVERERIGKYAKALSEGETTGIALIVLCDNGGFTGENINNFVWVTFTKSNPSHDVYGVGSFVVNKHWGCDGPIIIDARNKPHHAPELIKIPKIEQQVDALGASGGSLHGII